MRMFSRLFAEKASFASFSNPKNTEVLNVDCLQACLLFNIDIIYPFSVLFDLLDDLLAF